MTDYVRARTSVGWSEYDDYAIERGLAFNAEYTPTEVLDLPKAIATTGGQAIGIAHVPTSATLFFKNLDDTNFITVAYTTVADGVATTVKVLKGRIVVLEDIDTSAALTFTADTANCNCRMRMFG